MSSTDPSGSPRGISTGRPLLEYVTLPHCPDCVGLERLVGQIAADFPVVDVRKVPADSARGRALSIALGVLRFPVIVLDGEVIGVETISKEELRSRLQAAEDRERDG